jgi:hypothetical protein
MTYNNFNINLSDLSADNQDNTDDQLTISNLLNIIKNYNNFVNLSQFDNTQYNIFTNINIPDNVILFGILKLDPFDIYIWHEKKHNIILCGLKNLPIKSWYKIKKESELKTLIDFFKVRDKVYYNSHRFYINSNIDFLSLVNFVRDSDCIYKNIFIDEKDEVNKLDDNKLTSLDISIQYTNILKSNSDEIYFYTKYSNSKIRFENINGYIICELNYNHIKLRNRYDPSDKFMPFDISILLYQFELKSIHDILNANDLNMQQIDICVLLAKDKKNLSKLKTKLLELKKDVSDDIKTYIDTVIERIKSDEIYVQLENDGVFRSFENSVDILIKTVYERFVENKSNDLAENKSNDFAYINEILKYKVNNIFYSKLL